MFQSKDLIEQVIDKLVRRMRQNNLVRNNSPCILPQRLFHKMHARRFPQYARISYIVDRARAFDFGGERRRCAACSSFLFLDAKNFCNLRMNENETVIARRFRDIAMHGINLADLRLGVASR